MSGWDKEKIHSAKRGLRICLPHAQYAARERPVPRGRKGRCAGAHSLWRRYGCGCQGTSIPAPAWGTGALCLPSVRVPVAIYMPSPCAARSGTLENILMHGKNLTRRGREDSPALKHRNGPNTRICNHFNKGWVSLRWTVLYTFVMDMVRKHM